MEKNCLNRKKGHALIGFNHGLPCYVKNMALGPQLRQKPRPTASGYGQVKYLCLVFDAKYMYRVLGTYMYLAFWNSKVVLSTYLYLKAKVLDTFVR